MRNTRLLLPLILCSQLLVGCSWFGGDDDDAAIEPAELVKFDAEVKVKRQWSAKVGAGAREYFKSLRPAASAEAIFAAGYEGKVTACTIRLLPTLSKGALTPLPSTLTRPTKCPSCGSNKCK